MKIQLLSTHPNTDRKSGEVLVHKTFLELHSKTGIFETTETDGDLY